MNRIWTWTHAMEAALVVAYGLEPVAVIAASLGVSPRAVYNHAARLGLAQQRPQHTPALRAEMCRLSRAGQTDAEIAAALNVCRGSVRRARRQVSLPASAAGLLRTQRESIKKQRRTLGIKSGGELRALSYRKYAVENGWPAALRPREVQILNVLADRGVPMTRLELAHAIGIRTDRMGANGTLALLASCNGPGGTYTASLLRRGYLAVLKRACHVEGRGKGRSRDLYYLGPEALIILEQRCQTNATATSP